jgi:hypothetical protein
MNVSTLRSVPSLYWKGCSSQRSNFKLITILRGIPAVKASRPLAELRELRRASLVVGLQLFCLQVIPAPYSLNAVSPLRRFVASGCNWSWSCPVVSDVEMTLLRQGLERVGAGTRGRTPSRIRNCSSRKFRPTQTQHRTIIIHFFWRRRRREDRPTDFINCFVATVTVTHTIYKRNTVF